MPRKPPNPIPLGQRCTRCRTAQREPGKSSCAPCREKRAKAMRELREAVRAEVAKENAALDASQCLPNVAVPNLSTNVPEMSTVVQPRNSGDIGNVRVQEIAPVQESTRNVPNGQNAGIASGDSIGNGLVLVVPDLHAPLHDPRALCAVLSLMDAHKFDEVVFLGDEAELVSLSWFGGPDSLKKYKDEALEVRAVLMEFRRRHQGRMTSTVGNHTARIESAVERTKPQLAGSIKDEIGYDSLGIEVIPEDKVLVRGRIKFVHGHQNMGGKAIPVYHARLMADLYGVPGCSIVYGHTHRSQTFTRRMDEGNCTAYGLGCLEKRPRWLKGVCGWTQEVAVCHPSSGYVEPLRIIDGAIFYGGKCYRG